MHLWGQHGLYESLPGIHVLIWVNTLVHEQFTSLFSQLILCCNLKSLQLIGHYQLVKGGQQELGTVDELKLTERRIYTSPVVGYAGDLSSTFEIACINS